MVGFGACGVGAVLILVAGRTDRPGKLLVFVPLGLAAVAHCAWTIAMPRWKHPLHSTYPRPADPLSPGPPSWG
ncbi:MAG: hypothetical protein HOV68_11775 [Streptomycetaceae bacterium]|nr:hypothetical protein [Streptomycetaceae bacterium]